MTDHTAPLLIIVHPGSACGSADATVGRDNADQARLDMIQLIGSWKGSVAVIDSHLSDELDETWRRTGGELGEAIRDALKKAKNAGHHAMRIMGDDDSTGFNQDDAAIEISKQCGITAGDQVTLTGAWASQDGIDGCVNGVRATLESIGIPCHIEAALDPEMDGDEYRDDEPDPEHEDPEHLTGSYARSPKPT